jgi:hypothetical protein
VPLTPEERCLAQPAPSLSPRTPAPSAASISRGNKYSVEHHFKRILHNDDQPRTMHAEAERTDPTLIPEMVTEVIQRHEARRRARGTAWQAHVKTAQAWRAGIERVGRPRLKHAPPASTSTPDSSCDRSAPPTQCLPPAILKFLCRAMTEPAEQTESDAVKPADVLGDRGLPHRGDGIDEASTYLTPARTAAFAPLSHITLVDRAGVVQHHAGHQISFGANMSGELGQPVIDVVDELAKRRRFQRTLGDNALIEGVCGGLRDKPCVVGRFAQAR